MPRRELRLFPLYRSTKTHWRMRVEVVGPRFVWKNSEVQAAAWIVKETSRGACPP